ncbi:Aldose 1-epimerase [Paenibacillus sp. UNCCL117]|uniref:aldose 1-epimerase n=1 Tax=unclassified Paenibacillus TaxID=185978 RepID=UPI000883AA11|nr:MULTISPECIES: aldose 1-epimerase [unclassified Paenibacillus]SDE55507.1 Aldose 1-epimerase [Paenibacillus sp. cl123]SFW66423.1 Aldose 1-epimerase [Paenibacillus sp. UNCCL117]
MNHYRIDWMEKEGESVCRLIDEAAGATADLLPGFGMNIIRYVSGGKDVVLQPPSMAELRKTPFRYGIPALSPPGKTSNGSYAFRGVEYRLPLRDGGHNLHGVIGALPWRIESQGADSEDGAYLQASYTCRDDGLQFAAYPADLEFTVTVRLKEGELSLEGVVGNAGKQFAPFSLGYHPYFCCDLRRTVLKLPAFAQWPMAGGGPAALPEETALSASLREGVAVSGVEGNLHYLQCGRSDVSGRSEPYVCTLADSGSSRRIHFQTDGLFAVMVLFLPNWGEAVSLEPHTCIPDAFNLPWAASETGAGELAPGQQIRFGWRIRVENGASV